MQDTLNARFRAPLPDYHQRRIIVWMDETGEFTEAVNEIHLENARLLVMQKNHMFEIRKQIEIDYAQENLLIYCPYHFDAPQDNWLLDVFLYSEEFRADYWSLLFDELNIENNREMRDYARSVSAFFSSKDRRNKLKAIHEKYKTAKELRIGIYCVLCGVKTFDAYAILRKILSEQEEDLISGLEKYCGRDAFWAWMEEFFNYQGKHEKVALLGYIFNSAAMMETGADTVSWMQGNTTCAQNAYQFFTGWLREDPAGLLASCQKTEEYLQLSDRMNDTDRTLLLQIGVFPSVDQVLLKGAFRSFADNYFNTDDADTLIRARSDKPWHSLYTYYYKALRALADMQLFYMAHKNNLHSEDALSSWQNYETELYKMDQFYRLFQMAYDEALKQGVILLDDDLKAAQEAAERLYRNWFLFELNNDWTDKISGHTLEDSLPHVQLQSDFYSSHLTGLDSRTYVIISDGLRYEVAQQLTAQLNTILSGNAICDVMAGTIPTITPVGMAALLPHHQLYLTDDLKVLCDDMPTDAPSRESVLRKKGSNDAVVKFDVFLRMNRSQRQETVRNAKVVYIYHDVIDTAGESGAKVFAACENTVNEISQMMRILVNELSAANIFITSDHGFLNTSSPLDEYEKTDREVVEGGVLDYKRRHAIVKEPRIDPRAIYMPLNQLGRPDLTGVFPHGCMRFRLQGSNSLYMHGGLSLQELMIPLIHYQNKKAGQKGFTAITKAELLLLGDQRKISNNIFTLVFFQKEPCVGKVKPLQVNIRFEDANGNVISDEHKLNANSVSAENNDRTTRITFRLLGTGFERTVDYWLTVTDLEDSKELYRIPFKIDVVFGLDFGF